MADIVVPEDLTTLADDALSALAESVRAAAEAVSADAATSDTALAEVERLVGEFDRVNNEILSRDAKRQDRIDRAAAAIDRNALRGRCAGLVDLRA